MLQNHVQLTITQDSVGVSRLGFGRMLIASHNAPFPELFRLYTGTADMITDGFLADSPEVLAAASAFSQNPRPPDIAVGRLPTAPTLAATLSVTNVINNHTYSIRVRGEGVTETVASFTSDATATDGEIVVGLVAALEAVVGNNYVAAGAVSPFTVTGDAAGDWFSLEVLEPQNLSIAYDHADPGLAAELAAVSLENNDWYGLVTLYNSEAYVNAAAAYIETVKKLYVPDVNASASITAIAGGGDILDDLAVSAYQRTGGFYHPSPAEMTAAAWMGDMLPRDPGSATWKFKTLIGVPPVSLTATQRANLIAKNANSYELVAGVNITFEGTRADGDFLDVTRGIDKLEDDISKDVFASLASNPKIPYTDGGIAIIESDVRGALGRNTETPSAPLRLLAADPAPVVTVPKVANVAPADKTARILRDVKFTATLAGAVHKTNITGVVSV